MAESKKYYWLKLQSDFFKSRRIKKLRKLGADFVIIYLKMQLMTINSNGVIEYTGVENTLAEEIALEIDEDADKVQLTISFLQACNLLEINDNNEVFLPYVEKCTGENISDSGYKANNRERQQRFRDRQKALKIEQKDDAETENVTLRNVTNNVMRNVEIRDKSKEIRDKIINHNNNIVEQDSTTYQEIIDYLNLVCHTNYRWKSKNTQKHINARLSDGYSVDDFKTVIDKKSAEWLGTDMEKYLRPETLFGTKFESYLNQNIVKGGADKPRSIFDELRDC